MQRGQKTLTALDLAAGTGLDSHHVGLVVARACGANGNIDAQCKELLQILSTVQIYEVSRNCWQTPTGSEQESSPQDVCAAFVNVLAGHLRQDLELVPLTVLPPHGLHLPGLLLAVPAGHFLHLPLALTDPAGHAAGTVNGCHTSK